MKRFVLALGALALSAGLAAAQGAPNKRWGMQVEGLGLYQGKANLSEGGSFTASRAYLQVSGRYLLDGGQAIGLAVSSGKIDYDFDNPGADPWRGINDLRVSVPIAFGVGDNARVLLAPTVRWDYQDGASSGDGRTYGVFGGVTWNVGNSLRIGPALGVFNQIEDSSLEIFPALLVNYEAPGGRLNIGTGTSVGATQGPGLNFGYELTDTLTASLAFRSENLRFRLADQNRVGQDRSLPVVLGLTWAPQPYISASVFAGAEFNGQLQIEDSNGNEISEQNYDTAPITGFTFRLRF